MAFPTAVNSQITDAVSQSDSTPDAQTPASGTAPTDQATTEAAEGHGTGTGRHEAQEKDNGYTTADGHEGGNGLVGGGGDGAGI